jgi:hypothetical protein
MPFIGDLIALATKLHKVNDPAMDDCLANGQFILIRRDAYGTVGGHEAVKSSVIDDVSLGRAVKFHAPPGSLRYRLVYARKLMAVRMYEDLSGIWRGFTKNFFEAAQRKASWMVGLILYLLWMSVLPWVALFGPDRDWAAAAVSLTVAYRAMTWRFSPYPPWAMLLHPVAALLTAGIVADSTLRGLGLRKPVAWKGRPARV